MNTSIIILAAGEGTRMKSSTSKVLHKICGKTMLFLVINEALKLSDDVHVVLYHQMELVKDSVLHELKNANLDIQKISFHRQNHEKFPGTGGAIMGVKTRHPKILVLNGDMPLVRESSLHKICKDMEKHNAQIVMGVLNLDDPTGYGRVIFEDSKEIKNLDSKINSKIVKIIEQKDASIAELQIKNVNAGVYVFSKEILQKYLPHLSNDNVQKEYYITDIIYLAFRDSVNVCGTLVSEREFMGVNTKAHLAIAQDYLLERLRAQIMEHGVQMDLPSTIYLDFDAQILGECIIENNVRIEGASIIKDSHIKAHSIVKDSIIESSDIGPNAHIRPKCEIYNTHIGNFVECKNAKLQNVKAGHLSYLGDCEIGNNTNIGAGTITCNYDGKDKHRTIIGENVFIGSGSQLVAPINIESNSIIGAGSTITQNVKSGELAISRQKQDNITGFFYKFFKK